MKRILCFLLGHRWYKRSGIRDGSMFRERFCSRCDKTQTLAQLGGTPQPRIREV